MSVIQQQKPKVMIGDFASASGKTRRCVHLNLVELLVMYRLRPEMYDKLREEFG